MLWTLMVSVKVVKVVKVVKAVAAKENQPTKALLGNLRSKTTKAKEKGGKALPPTTRFEGTCDNCGKWGHKKSECWSKQNRGNKTANQRARKGHSGKGGEGKIGKGGGTAKGVGLSMQLANPMLKSVC